jgi:general secretion pathway protein D
LFRSSLALLALWFTQMNDARADAPPPTLAAPQVVPVNATQRATPPSTPAAAPTPTATPAPEPTDHPPILAAPELHFEAKSPDYKVSLVLEDAELSELVRTIGQLTGRRFIVASAHAKGLKATLYAPEKVSVAEAYEAFLAVLQANALTVIPSGAFWKIVDTQDVSKQSTPVVLANEGATSEERYVTRVLRLHHVSAEDVAANVLSKFATRDAGVVPYAPGNLLILTDTGENIRRMQHILEDVDVAQPGDKVWLVPLFYVSAADMEKKLADVFDLKSAGKTNAPGIGGDKLTRLVALDRPNALIVVGGEASYKRLLAFLERIDVPMASEGAIHVVPLEHSDAKKIVPAINEALQAAGPGSQAKGANGAEPLALLDSAVKVSAEETTNSILVTSSEHDFAAVRDVIAKLDKPKRQVYIEVVVMDVELLRDTNVGVQWHGLEGVGNAGTTLYGGNNAFNSIAQPAAAAAGATTDTTLQALALGIRGPSITALGETIPAFGAFIEASAHTVDSDILQTPHILATDNVPSEFHVTVNRSLQQNAPSYQSIATGTAGTASPYLGTAPASLNYKPLGPQIKVTPHVNESDDVRLDIVETISDTTGIPEGTLGNLPYTERGATTTLTVHDQQTCVIGGLVADKVSHETVKIPLLGDLPLLGALFRRTNDTHEKSDLVLVLTPYIVRDQEDMRRIVEKRMDERQELLDHQALFSDRPIRPTKTFARARGLLGLIRRSEIAADDEAANEAMLLRRPPKTHEATDPVDLPATAVTPTTTATADGAKPAVTPQAAARVER